MEEPHQTWLDDDAGPVVRPYTLTGGRTRPTARLDLVAFVLTVEPLEVVRHNLQPEHVAALELCRQPTTVAEVAAHLDLPVGVVRVLISDLMEAGLVMVREPGEGTRLPEPALLESVLRGLESL